MITPRYRAGGYRKLKGVASRLGELLGIEDECYFRRKP
jgi:hypothetical protein